MVVKLRDELATLAFSRRWSRSHCRRPGHASSNSCFVRPIPGDILPQALRQARFGSIAELIRRSIDCRERLPDVARLFRQCLDVRGLSRARRLSLQSRTLERLAGHSRGCINVQLNSDRSADDAVDDVKNVGVVATARAVAEHGHGQTLVDQPGELGDGQVRRLRGP